MSKYYDPTDKIIQDGTIADSPDINKVNSSTSAGFDLVEADIIDIASGQSYWAQDAKSWAINPYQPSPGYESSRTYALQAKADWERINALEPKMDQVAVDAVRAEVAAGNALISQSTAKISEQNAAAAEANTSVAQNITASCAGAAYDARISAEDSAIRAEKAAALGQRVQGITHDMHTATAGATSFTSSSPVDPNHPESVQVFMNSRMLRTGEDYTLTPAGITLTAPAIADDEIDIFNWNFYDIAVVLAAAAATTANVAAAATSETNAAASERSLSSGRYLR